jgi:hypothetical protein
MSGFSVNLVVGLLVIAAAAYLVVLYAPKMMKTVMPPRSGAREGFQGHAQVQAQAQVPAPASETTLSSYGSDSMGSVPMNAAKKPKDCYPREQLNPTELLPSDVNSAWAAVNPHGAGDIQGKNFLSAGSLVGVNTVGQSLRNANYQLRSEPPNPQVQVGPWMQTTIEPDLQRRPIE